MTTHRLVQTAQSHTLVQTSESHVLRVTDLVLPDQGYVTSNVVDTIVTLTQAAYNAIPVPDPATLYVIIL